MIQDDIFESLLHYNEDYLISSIRMKHDNMLKL